MYGDRLVFSSNKYVRTLRGGTCLFSQNKDYKLCLQWDGNLVHSKSSTDEMLWSTGKFYQYPWGLYMSDAFDAFYIYGKEYVNEAKDNYYAQNWVLGDCLIVQNNGDLNVLTYNNRIGWKATKGSKTGGATAYSWHEVMYAGTFYASPPGSAPCSSYVPPPTARPTVVCISLFLTHINMIIIVLENKQSV